MVLQSVHTSSWFGLFLLFTTIKQGDAESTLLLVTIQNRTSRQEYNGIHTILYRSLSLVPQFSGTILDTSIHVDSFPDEQSILKARQINAKDIIWAVIDSTASGAEIIIHIFDMGHGTITHFRIWINGNGSGQEVAGLMQSKLQLWLQRTTMAQLVVVTKPSESSVIIDGTKIGETPFEGMVQPGTYRLEVVKKGLLPVRIPASFISGNSYEYDITLGSIETRINKRQVITWLGVALALIGAGGIAHFQRRQALAEYHEATPPADFNALYRRALAWDTGRDILFVAGGIAGGIMLIKVAF